ncbi:MAG: hypothetical protein PHS46_03465 [Candidatus Omnitrophica bacterium]|nr:hypothetical protein [Candidatus Omnitrophota bacterium]
MKLLVIFDNSIDIEKLRLILDTVSTEGVAIFPLTAEQIISDRVKGVLGEKFNDIEYIDSITETEKQVGIIRGGISKWSADIGDGKVGARTVKERLILPGYDVSAWWLSFLAEKSTCKTDAFFRLAQARAVKVLLAGGKYKACIEAVSDEGLRKSILLTAIKNNVCLKTVSAYRKKGTTVAVYLIKSFLYGAQFFMRACYARRVLGPFGKREPAQKSLLFVTYFPAVEISGKDNGVFRNKYATALQDKLKELRIPVAWLLMYCLGPDSGSFNEAVKTAERFAKGGDRLFMLEEFLALKDFVKSIALWLRQVFIAGSLIGDIDKKILLAAPFGEESEPIIRELWNESFYGPKSIDGILHFIAFKNIFTTVPNIGACLYYCEMQAWEKALNAAKKYNREKMGTIGFLHTSVSRNDFQYLYGKGELDIENGVSALPQPDTLVCNGEAAYDYFTRLGYRDVVKAESIRYLYLDKILTSEISHPAEARPILLVAGSLKESESTPLVVIADAAAAGNKDWEVWFKWHPAALPLDKIFAKLGIDRASAGYLIRTDNISDCLSRATAVIVPTSTVAIEALAFGCEVIVPYFPNSIQLNPLTDFDGYCHKVRSSAELAETLKKIAGGYRLHTIREYRDFIRRYWCLDEKLGRWEDILKTRAKI